MEKLSEDEFCNDPKCEGTREGIRHKYHSNNELLSDIDKIKIEKGDHFLAVNPETNTVYVSNNKSDSILVIDGSSNKVVNRIEIERPRKLIINSNSKRLYAISGKAGILKGDVGKQISVIDTSSNKIIKSFEKNKRLLDMAINPKTNLLYAISKGYSSVSIFDCSSNTFVGKIILKNVPSVIAVDADKNKIYVGRDANPFEKPYVYVFDGDSKKLEKTTTGKRNFNISGAISFVEIHVNPKSNMIYLLVVMSSSMENEKPFLWLIKENTNKIEKTNFNYSMEDCMELDPSRNRIYFSNTKKRKILILDKNLEEIGSIQYALEWEGWLNQRGGTLIRRLVLNPTTSKIYLIGIDEDNNHCLYVVDDLKNN